MVLSRLGEGTAAAVDLRGIAFSEAERVVFRAGPLSAAAFRFASGVDAILTPATPSAAFGLGEMSDKDPVEMYLLDVFTVTLNLAGLPGISVPAGLDKRGLPLGMQLIGRPWDEGGLLNLAQTLESAAGFTAKPARWW